MFNPLHELGLVVKKLLTAPVKRKKPEPERIWPSKIDLTIEVSPVQDNRSQIYWKGHATYKGQKYTASSYDKQVVLNAIRRKIKEVQEFESLKTEHHKL